MEKKIILNEKQLNAYLKEIMYDCSNLTPHLIAETTNISQPRHQLTKHSEQQLCSSEYAHVM